MLIDTENSRNALNLIFFQLNIFRRQMSPFHLFSLGGGGGVKGGQCHRVTKFFLSGLPLLELSLNALSDTSILKPIDSDIRATTLTKSRLFEKDIAP